jgi:glycine betaine/proline transport system substrate-binding protein
VRSPRPLPLLSVAVALLLALAACGEPPADPDEAAPDVDEEEAEEVEDELADVPEGSIVVYDGQWESLWIVNEIFRLIVEEGYGHDVEIVTMSTPVMQQGMPDGDVHVAVELWCVNIQEWCDRESEQGTVEIAGTIFSEAEQGWYVPSYVIEGDPERDIEPLAPDLESVFDLPEYADVFSDPDDPSKGLIIRGITGWEVTELTEAKVYAYGLDDTYNTQAAGSVAALDAAIAGAYERGEPILFYYWAPSWIRGAFDVVLLDEPEWTPECQAALDEAVQDPTNAPEDAGCAFLGGEIYKGMYPGLRDMAPDVADFFERMYVGDPPIDEAQAYMQTEQVDPEDAALWYFENYDDWRDWIVEDDVLERVEEALREAGANV